MSLHPIPTAILAIAAAHGAWAQSSSDIHRRAGFNCPPGTAWSNHATPGCVSSASPGSVAMPCNGATLSWAGGGGTPCQAHTPPAPSGTVRNLTSTSPNSGSASFVCTHGAWSPIGTVVCSAPTPMPTLNVSRTPRTASEGAAYTVAWSASNATRIDYACSGGFSGGGSVATMSGSASGTYLAAWVGETRCVWTASGAAGSAQAMEDFTVTASASPPPPANCAAQAVTWAQFGSVCGSVIASASEGATLQLDANGSLNLNQGYARFTCSGGSWVLQSGAQCRPPITPTGSCSAQTVSWAGLNSGTNCQAVSPALAKDEVVTLANTVVPQNQQMSQWGSYTVKCVNGTLKPEPPDVQWVWMGAGNGYEMQAPGVATCQLECTGACGAGSGD